MAVKQGSRHFEGFGLIPQPLRRRVYWRAPKAHYHLLMFARQPDRLGHRGHVAPAGGEHYTESWIDSPFAGQCVALKEWQRKFDGDELMPFAATTYPCQPRSGLRIKPGGGRAEFKRAAARPHLAMSGHVEANLQTTGMKTPRPIKIALGLEVMPLDAVTQFAKIPVQRPPAVADAFPCGRLRKPRFVPAFLNARFSFNRQISSHKG
jgi:hypothetical protein